MIRASLTPLVSLCALLVMTGCYYGGIAVTSDLARANPYVDGGPPARPLSYDLSDPHRCNNLTVYFIRGEESGPVAYLSLQDALATGRVVVEETGSVNRLAIENRSDRAVFVHSGDIVKGGHQDRTIAEDLVLPPHSGRLPLDSFCVEHGRWTQRGNESGDHFDASTAVLASKDLRLAARYQENQSLVWQGVSAIQEKLSAALAKTVTGGISPSSLQLTLENPLVARQANEYVQGLEKLPDSRVAGCAILINGKLSQAEIYSSPAAFASAWPKLLYASAIEAMSRVPERADVEPDVPAIRQALIEAESGHPSTRQINEPTRIFRYDSPRYVMFETRDQAAMVRRSFLVK